MTVADVAVQERDAWIETRSLAARAKALADAAAVCADFYPSLDTRAAAVVLLRMARESDPRDAPIKWNIALCRRIDAWAVIF